MEHFGSLSADSSKNRESGRLRGQILVRMGGQKWTEFATQTPGEPDRPSQSQPEQILVRMGGQKWSPFEVNLKTVARIHKILEDIGRIWEGFWKDIGRILEEY